MSETESENWAMATEDCTYERVGRDAVPGTLVRDAMVTSPKTMPADGTVADLRVMFANPHVMSALLVDGPKFVGLVDRDSLRDQTPDGRSARSLVAVAVFMATGIATTFVVRHVIGAAS